MIVIGWVCVRGGVDFSLFCGGGWWLVWVDIMWICYWAAVRRWLRGGIEVSGPSWLTLSLAFGVCGVLGVVWLWWWSFMVASLVVVLAPFADRVELDGETASLVVWSDSIFWAWALLAVSCCRIHCRWALALLG